MRVLGALGLWLVLAPVALGAAWNVLDEGALNDGKADCTAAFQQALDKAEAAGGGVVSVPTGHFRIDGGLKVGAGVTLQGVFRAPPTNAVGAKAQLAGSVLLAYGGRGDATADPLLRLTGSNATVAGLLVVYPEWKQTDVPPVAYPPTVLAEHIDNPSVLDCCFVNPYEAIHFQGVGRFLVRNVYGYPSFRGLYVDACYDVGRVENCHFWPFGVAYKQDDPYCKWINTNGVAFEFARTDWQYVLNTFCFGYGVGYKFSETDNGACNGNFVGIGADSCRRPVLVEQCQSPGLLITNGEFVGRWGSEDSVGIEIDTVSKGKVSLNNCSFWGPLDHALWLKSPSAQLTAIGCNFAAWDVAGKGSAAIQIDAGRVIVQGNTFAAGEKHVAVGERAVSAIIIGNQARGGMRIDNAAGPRMQASFNETSPVQWSGEALTRYRIDVGSDGDSPYLEGWHAGEAAGEWPDGEGTKRWSGPEAFLVLPVLPDKTYTLSVDIYVPTYAAAEGNGLYMGDYCVAKLTFNEEQGVVSGVLPAMEAKEARVELRVKEWSPKECIEGNSDVRTLGAAVRSVLMEAVQDKSRVFDACAGDWVDEKTENGDSK
ncbi:MAG: hypothetical protein GWP08_00875 [Nitrospiraceae bacterium]|nr:hypothetical protein [Nitrospiraceae bacterium]